MQHQVTAVVVARNDEAWIPGTLQAIRTQSRRPERVLLVDAASHDRSVDALNEVAPGHVITSQATTFGAGIERALLDTPRASGPDEWLWLLTGNTAPDPDALAELLAAIEVAPSVVIAGPKLVDPDDDRLLRSFGETLSDSGAEVALVEDEFDQAQHDRETDVMAVAAEGMLVRRDVWEQLGGFDPGLPTIGAGLDLGIRARLAGHRVQRVPRARVSRARPPESFGRDRVGAATRVRVARRAHLHRRLVAAPAAAVPFLWLGLLPMAVIRSVLLLLAKRPLAVIPELLATLQAAFDRHVLPARRRLARTRRVGWSALAPLRIPADEMRERRAADRERRAALSGDELVRASFLGDGGAGVVIAVGLVGLVLGWRLLGAERLLGGALLPLSDSVTALWSTLGWGVLDPVTGQAAPADPFAAVVAVLGSLTAWDPSFSLVILFLAAPALSALAAWWAATRFSTRAAAPALVALLYGLGSPLIAALGEGRPAAVVVHILLPWLVLTVVEARRSWSAAAAASLLAAAVCAASPMLAPVVLVLLVAAALARPRSILRGIGIPVLTLVLAAPLVLTQLDRSDLLAVLADPGLAVAYAVPDAVDLLLGRPVAGEAGWSLALDPLGLPVVVADLAQAVLLLPLVVLALLALLTPRGARAIAPLVAALGGVASAQLATLLPLTTDGASAVVPWAGAPLSLVLLGLLLAAAVGLDAVPRAAGRYAVATGLAAVLAIAPAAAALVLGSGVAVSTTAERLPALVVAEGVETPAQAVLVLDPAADGSLAASLERGSGTTLEQAAAAVSTRPATSDADRALTELAGNLASVGGYDAAEALDRFDVRFVLLTPLEAGERATRTRVAEGLDASVDLVRVGSSDAGDLWRVAEELPVASSDPTDPREPWALGALIAVAAIALLLAIPTGPRRPVSQADSTHLEAPADTFDEEDAS